MSLELALHNEKLHSLCRSHNIARIVKCRGFGWAEHVARTGLQRMNTQFWWVNLLENRDRGEKATLRWILGTEIVREGGGGTDPYSCPVAAFGMSDVDC